MRAKCINITKEIFQQPIGIFVHKELRPFMEILPSNILSLDKIEAKLEKWEYLIIDEWHDDIVGLLKTVSHECDNNLSIILDTLIQMIEDEINGFIYIKEEKVINDIRFSIEHYLPNSKFDFIHDRKPPPLPQSIPKRMPENAPVFAHDSINSLKERIYNIKSTHIKSQIAKIIKSSSANTNVFTEIKGSITVVFESLSPYTLQLIQNYLDKIERYTNSFYSIC